VSCRLQQGLWLPTKLNVLSLLLVATILPAGSEHRSTFTQRARSGYHHRIDRRSIGDAAGDPVSIAFSEESRLGHQSCGGSDEVGAGADDRNARSV